MVAYIIQKNNFAYYINLYINKINWFNVYEISFNSNCQYGHMDVAKWLYDNGICHYKCGMIDFDKTILFNAI